MDMGKTTPKIAENKVQETFLLMYLKFLGELGSILRDPKGTKMIKSLRIRLSLPIEGDRIIG